MWKGFWRNLLKNTTFEKRLGIKIDQPLNFDDHVNILFKKTSDKLRCLARVKS